MRSPCNLIDLMNFCKEEWKKIARSRYAKLVDSHLKILSAVLHSVSSKQLREGVCPLIQTGYCTFSLFFEPSFCCFVLEYCFTCNFNKVVSTFYIHWMSLLILVQDHTKLLSAYFGSLNSLVVCMTDGPVQWPCFLSEGYWSSEVCIKRKLGDKSAWTACLHMTALHGSHRDNTCTISPPLGHWQNMPKHLILSLFHLSIATSSSKVPVQSWAQVTLVPCSGTL